MKPELTLIERAAVFVAAFDRAEKIRAHLDDSDADHNSQLAALDAEIAALDRKADGTDEGIITKLMTKRESRTRLAAKFQRDRSALEQRIEAEVRVVIRGVEPFRTFFNDALEIERAAAIAAILPFMESEWRAKTMCQNFDSVNALGYWTNLCLKIPTTDIVRRLRPFADGEVALFRI